MPIQIPAYTKVKDFYAFEQQFLQNKSFQQFFKSKDQNSLETTDCEEFIFKPTRSQKSKIKDPELSFEENFMKQHLEAYDFYVQSYMEQMLEGQPLIGSKNFINESVFPKKSLFADGDSQLQYYLKSNCCLLDNKKAQIFMEDLMYEQKLYQFLSYICDNSCDQVALEVIFVANEVWERYLQIKKQELSQQKLIQYSKNLVENNWKNIKNEKLIKFLTLENTKIKPSIQQIQRIAQQKKFFCFLFVTMFLVISEYFSNPYYDQKIQTQLKRQLFFNPMSFTCQQDSFSDDQESHQSVVFFHARKKLK